MKDENNNSYGNPFDSDNVRDGDVLESMTAGVVDKKDSASSASDAGLIDVLFDSDTDMDSEYDEAGRPREIPMSDLEVDSPQLYSNEMSDMSAPGEIDIDGLDERAVEALLPPDARLDPLED